MLKIAEEYERVALRAVQRVIKNKNTEKSKRADTAVNAVKGERKNFGSAKLTRRQNLVCTGTVFI